MRLSGGQLRRLSLARAFVDPCDLVILDEPDAHLDIESLALLEDTVSSLQNVARIIISHRGQTLAKADRILNMEAP
jgi:ABC-type transport system involved in cytochrome bd biosynthesis fused ATPase/permease subunit